MKLPPRHLALVGFPFTVAAISCVALLASPASTEGASPEKPESQFQLTTADALEGEIRASQLLGKKVYDSEQRRVGTLKDIIFTREAINLTGAEAVQNRANRDGANRDITIAGITTNTTENPANALLGDRASGPKEAHPPEKKQNSGEAKATEKKSTAAQQETPSPNVPQSVAVIAVDAGIGPTRLFRVPFSEVSLDVAQDRLMLAIKREALE
ncbi:MAG TPA: PRC-barrel domain-containing protein [Opitutaceae bacterium]|nr:PRC-barrel domain-containing protein [Opitutaceae bacterium]